MRTRAMVSVALPSDPATQAPACRGSPTPTQIYSAMVLTLAVSLFKSPPPPGVSKDLHLAR